MKGKLMSVLVSGRMPQNESCIHEYNYKHSSGASCLRKGKRKTWKTIKAKGFSLLHSRGPIGFVAARACRSWQLKGLIAALASDGERDWRTFVQQNSQQIHLGVKPTRCRPWTVFHRRFPLCLSVFVCASKGSEWCLTPVLVPEKKKLIGVIQCSTQETLSVTNCQDELARIEC